MDRFREALASAGAALLGLVLVAALVMLTNGCAVKGAVGKDVLPQGPGTVVTAPPPQATPIAPKDLKEAAKAAAQRWMDTLGEVSVDIEAFVGAERLKSTQIRAWDHTKQDWFGTIDGNGYGSITIPFRDVIRWEILDGSSWRAVPPPVWGYRRDGTKIRGVIDLPVAMPEPLPTPPPARFLYPSGVESYSAKRTYLVRLLGQAPDNPIYAAELERLERERR